MASVAYAVGLILAALIGVAAGWFLARRGRARAVATARDTATTGTFKLADELYARTRRLTELESKLAAARAQGTALRDATEVAKERVHALEAEAESRVRAISALESELARTRARAQVLEAAARERAPAAQAAPGVASPSARARRAARLPEDPRPARATPAADGDEPDDLKLIHGVGPALEQLLHRHGIYTYRQIAAWTRADVEAMAAKRPALTARIQRDHWIEGARAEHRRKYGRDP